MNFNLESLQMQLEFEEIMNDNPSRIIYLRKEIRDIKLRYLFLEEERDNIINEIINEKEINRKS